MIRAEIGPDLIADTVEDACLIYKKEKGVASRLILFVDRVNLIINYIAGLLLLSMSVIMLLQISVRSILPRIGISMSLPWTEELPRFLLVWFIFLGAAVAARAGDLIAVEALTNILKERASKLVRCFALVATIGFLAFLVWCGMRWVSFGQGETSLALGIRMSWVYLSLPVGAFFAIFSVLVRLYECATDTEDNERKASDLSAEI